MPKTATQMATADVERAPVPSAPANIDDTGLTADQVSQLFVKSLFTGEATGTALSERLRLPYEGQPVGISPTDEPSG